MEPPQTPPPAVEGVAPVEPGAPSQAASTPAALLGPGPALTLPSDPATVPIPLAISSASGAYVESGRARMWGDHPEHVPYENEGYGPITLEASEVVQVVLRGPSATVLRQDGSVVEFNQDDRGGSRRTVSVPPMRFLAGSGAEAMCGVTRRSEVVCWGGFAAGYEEPSMRPRPIRGIRGALRVAIRDQVGLALLEDGTVRTFGFGADDVFGLGEGDGEERAGRVEQPALEHVVDVVAAPYTFCALRNDGTVWCWGQGLGAAGDAMVPTQLASIDGVVSLHASPSGLCVRRRDESVACIGELPDGLVHAGARAMPCASFETATALQGARALVIAEAHACWLGSEGVRCIGHNTLGELGVMPRRSAVLAVPGVRGARWVSASGSQSCAGTTDAVYCWRGGPVTPLALPNPSGIGDVWIDGERGCVLREGVRECYRSLFDASTLTSTLRGVESIAGPCALLETGEAVCGVNNTPTPGPLGPFRALRFNPQMRQVAALHRDGLHVTQFTLALQVNAQNQPEGYAISSSHTTDFAEPVDDIALQGSTLCTRRGREASCGRSVRPEVDELEAGGLRCFRSGGTVQCEGYIDAPALIAISGVPHPDVLARGALPGLTDARALAVGEAHVCALRATGEVACFGDSRSDAVGTVPAWMALEPVTPAL